MNRPAVFIATTGGPVQIERIIRERAPLSLVMLGRSARSLPISGDYDDFVRPASGPVDRFLGPFPAGGFRLELSAAVDCGDSWQLAVFIAHALAAADGVSLAASLDDADAVLWLSGTVDYDGQVGPVGSIADKLDSTASAFADWRRRGLPVTLATPAGDDSDRVAAVGETIGATALAADDVRGLCRALDLPRPAPCIEARTVAAGRRSRRRIAGAALLALAAGGTVAAATSGTWWPAPTGPQAAGTAQPAPAAAAVPPAVVPRITQAVHRPQPATAHRAAAGTTPARRAIARPPHAGGEPSVQIIERRAPPGEDCRAVHFGDADAVLRPVPLDRDGRPHASRREGLCGLAFVVELGKASRYVRAGLDIDQGRIAGPAAPPPALSGGAAVQGTQHWRIDLPARRFDGLQYRLRVTIADHPLPPPPQPAAAGGRQILLAHAVSD